MTWNTELMATRTAAASRSPHARSFQMNTIAMHRASPTMISPVRYSGRSGRKIQASVNMNAGPTSQLRTSESVRSVRSPVTRWVSSYRTFASTGYIITSSPIAIGSEIPPTCIESRNVLRPGTNRPSSSPSAIAARIQMAR